MATTLTRWRPFENFGELQTRFDRVFEDLVADGSRRDWTPALDVVTNRDNLVVRADMPGIKPEEIGMRSIALPAGVETDKIDATYKDGELEVTIPTPEAKKAAPIEIKAKAA
jgi:HSP20 family protein